MNFREPRWLHVACFALGALAAAPAWACTGADDATLSVGTPGLGLTLTTSVDKASARPGDVLSYTLAFCNAGDSAISGLQIGNATPAATAFVAASCGTPPADLTCVVSAQPAPGGSGTIVWTLDGTLAPGASGVVDFKASVR